MGGVMKYKTSLQNKTAPNRHTQKQNSAADQSLLLGLPLRHCRKDDPAGAATDWFASLSWLRAPLLALGIIGALGLLAEDNARFAKMTSLIHWPGAWISFVFLGISGCVFFFLLVECIFVRVTRCIRLYQRKQNPERINWRTR